MVPPLENGPLGSLLSRLNQVTRRGDGWMACCPAHDDKHPSLSVGLGEDRVLLRCHAGCTFDDIILALGLRKRDLFLSPAQGKEGVTLSGRTATLQRSCGCTLEQCATMKQLPVDRLRSFGLSDRTYAGAPAVRIPYHDVSGIEASVRYRVGLDKVAGADDRFRWKKGSKPGLYGLDRLGMAQARGSVTLVEGESDCHTLWYHDEPAIGVPGAALWRDNRDAALLEDIPTIYLVVEPDEGGETLLQRLTTSVLADRVRLVRLGEHKDPSALYLADPASFPMRWAAALAASVPLSEYQAARLQAQAQEDWDLCADLARTPKILDVVAEALAAKGLVGDARNRKLLFLAVTSRLMDRPVSIALKGPSSGGKSFELEQVLSLFPSEAYYALSAMSERALAYSMEPLKHRMLVLYEASGMDGEIQSYLIRTLLSEGRIRYETVESTPAGLTPKLIEREGPTGLIVTTTAERLHPENETRILSLLVDDSQDQTKAVLRALASECDQDIDLAPFHALQRHLAANVAPVSIPYISTLVELIPPVAIRLRRDVKTLLTLIKTHALLHQASRERDEAGKIVATLEDYEAIHALLAETFAEGAEATVPPTVRETVEAVTRLVGTDQDKTVGYRDIGEALGGLDKSVVSRRVTVAIHRGLLRNDQERRGKPAKIGIADSLPEDRSLLPTPAQLKSCLENGGAVAPDVNSIRLGASLPTSPEPTNRHALPAPAPLPLQQRFGVRPGECWACGAALPGDGSPCTICHPRKGRG